MGAGVEGVGYEAGGGEGLKWCKYWIPLQVFHRLKDTSFVPPRPF